jgi:uncharacterized protein YqgV (UPF0045/DUF77 family)
MKQEITAQLSLYALGRTDYRPEVDNAIATLAELGLNPKVGALSTTVTSEADEIFAAIRAVFEQASQTGPTVLTVTLANATPGDILSDKYPMP